MRVYISSPMTATLSPAVTTERVSVARPVLRTIAVLGFAAMMGITTEAFRVPLPGTPVPVTLQSLVAVLAAATLGPRLGILSMFLFLLAGATGLLSYVGGPQAFLHGITAGYLVGFLLAQPVMGIVTRIPPLPPRQFVFRMFLAGFLGHIIIFLCGVIGLMIAMPISVAEAVNYGVLPFMPGTILKIAAGMVIGVPLLVGVRRHMER